MGFLKRNFLYFAVFITGAAVLVIEVVATRILAPYFGNTIFSVSSIIGVVLAALSFGYYFGGRLADKYPDIRWFFSIITAGGVAVFLIQVLVALFLPWFSRNLSLIIGPLISAIVLFFAPAFFLGMLSPFAIKLQTQLCQKEGIGTLSGKIFFYSTFGSIFGSLFSGFFLIPVFGIKEIVLATGFILLLLGFGGLLFTNIKKKDLSKLSFACFIVIFVSLLCSFLNVQPGLVFSKDGRYEKILVYDMKTEEQEPIRILKLDSSFSGGIYLNKEEQLFDYTKYYLLYRIFKPDLKNTLVIGGGAYTIPKALLKVSDETLVEVAEIEPSLLGVAKKYFGLADEERLKNYIEDGRRFLERSENSYDLIYSDAFNSAKAIPAHLSTREFFQLVKEHLSKDGIFIINAVGRLEQRAPSLLFSQIKTFKIIFPNSYYFDLGQRGSSGMRNIIFVGYNSDKVVDFKDSEVSVKVLPEIQELDKKLIDIERFDLTKELILTDNYSPVDYLSALAFLAEDKDMEKISQVCFKDSCFKVKTAETAAERSKGLMEVEQLEEDRGMLFIFDHSGVYAFWMKNTLIPLDMVWLDKDKKIVFIKHNAQPCKKEPCESFSPGKEAKYVLEINGGLAEKLGLEIGERAVFK